jgi:hypothetical protein
MSARYGALDDGPGRPAVAEEIRRRKWFITRLIVHVLPASGERQRAADQQLLARVDAMEQLP